MLYKRRHARLGHKNYAVPVLGVRLARLMMGVRVPLCDWRRFASAALAPTSTARLFGSTRVNSFTKLVPQNAELYFSMYYSESQ